MDSTTSAHIDPSSLQASAPTYSGDIPSLSVKPTITTTSTTSTTSPTSAKAQPETTGLRQRVNHLGSSLDSAADHPAVKNAKGAAQSQIARLREFLGRSGTVRDLEKRFNVDRVFLVAGAAFLYILLIPLNLFGLALPTTTFLTLLPPTFMALKALDTPQSNGLDDEVKSLLSYFVALGFVQFLESLAAGLLERKIPQYYTIKLILLAYLLHPQTKGATQLHNMVLKPALQAVQTPSSSTSSSSYKTTTLAQTPPTSTGIASGAGSPTVKLPSGGGTGVGLEVEK